MDFEKFKETLMSMSAKLEGVETCSWNTMEGQTIGLRVWYVGRDGITRSKGAGYWNIYEEGMPFVRWNGDRMVEPMQLLRIKGIVENFIKIARETSE